MGRRGRPPLTSGHVEQLAGSPRAKERLVALLQTLSGEWTIGQAASALGISESRLHALRQQWLRGAVELLEPRPMGRPPREAAAGLPDEETAELRRQLRLAQARLEVAELRGGTTAEKKGTSAC